MPIQKKIFGRFERGFISALDVNTEAVTDQALSDCRNIEINDPLFKVSSAKGYAAEQTYPSMYGSDVIALRQWSVNTPSSKELITLITKSRNLLYFSEDFELTDWWDSGGTVAIRPNDLTAPDGTYTSADVLTPQTDGVMVQDITTVYGGVAIPIGTAVTFSVYVSVPVEFRTVTVTIGDNSAETVASFNPTAGWVRINVTKTMTSLTGQYVRVKFPEGDNTEEYGLWGAQLEVGSVKTGYGRTTYYNRPYYIFLKPYYTAGAWVEDWLELTETRAGKITATNPGAHAHHTGQITVCLGLPISYFKNFYIQDIVVGLQPTLAVEGTRRIILDSERILDRITLPNFDTNTKYTVNDTVVVSRNIIPLVLPFSYTYNIVEKDIRIFEYLGKQVISFINNQYPVIIKYNSFTNFFYGADSGGDDKQISFTGFILDKNIRISSALAPTHENDGLDVVISTSSPGTGTIPTGTYYIRIVGVFDDNERYDVNFLSDNVSITLGDVINFEIWVRQLGITKRLKYIEAYLGSSNSESSMIRAFQLDPPNPVHPVTSAALAWTFDTTIDAYGLTAFYVNSYNTLNPTYPQSVAKGKTIGNEIKYTGGLYHRGRVFTYGNYGKGNYLRFSNLAGLVEEVDLFPYSESEGFGYIIVDSGSADEISGIATTSSGDLLIFKRRSTFLYEIASAGQYGRRLISAFKGVGCSNARGIVNNTDFGTFWYDENDIYNYYGGVQPPKRISEGKISNYWRSLTGTNGHFSTYADLKSSFAIFNRKLSEYWIFTRITDGTTYASFCVLRYSPVYDNWNIYQFSAIPVAVTEKLDGTLLVMFENTLTAETGYFYYGTGAPNVKQMFKTHQRNVSDDYDLKHIHELFAGYDCTNSAIFYIYINDESGARSTITMVSSKKFDKRPICHGALARKFTLMAEDPSIGVKFNIVELGVTIEDIPPRYGR